MYLSPKWVTTLRGSTQGKRPVAGNDGCRGRGRLAAGGGRTRHSSPRDDRTGSRSVAVAADRAKLRKLKRVFQCRSSLQGFIYRIVKRLHSAVVRIIGSESANPLLGVCRCCQLSEATLVTIRWWGSSVGRAGD